MIKQDVKTYSATRIDNYSFEKDEEMDISINGCVVGAKFVGKTETGGLAFDFKLSDIIEIAENFKVIIELTQKNKT